MMAVEQHFTMLCLRAEALGGGSLGAFPLLSDRTWLS